MNLIQQLEQEQMAKLSAGKTIPDFGPGDTVLVNVKVVEGDRTRMQAYEGVCIGRAGNGLNENFTVRKISYGEGVERVFPLYSPMIDSIKVVRRGKVRRAKLYYLRGAPRQVRAHQRAHGAHHRNERSRGVGQNSSFRGASRAREPGIHEHRLQSMDSGLPAALGPRNDGLGERPRFLLKAALSSECRTHFFCGASSIQRWPKGSVTMAKRSPQNMSDGSMTFVAPRSMARL